MQPEQQIEKLHEAMELLNRGNAREKDVVEMFETLAKAIKDIRSDLEKKIGDSGTKTSKLDQKTRTSLLATERRLSTAIEKAGKSSQGELNALKKAFMAELSAVKKSIPLLPDFQSMLSDIEAKIPTFPEIPTPIEYEAGENIKIENRTIHNTNPKITVSRERPRDPIVNDIWIQ
jgi:uncharacterized phage infection (PIP) family protein YhgE